MYFFYVYRLIMPIHSYITFNISTSTHIPHWLKYIFFGDTNVVPVAKLLKLQIPHCKPLISLLYHLIYTILLLQIKFVNNDMIGVSRYQFCRMSSFTENLVFGFMCDSVCTDLKQTNSKFS
jgi:hypothetical protein